MAKKNKKGILKNILKKAGSAYYGYKSNLHSKKVNRYIKAIKKGRAWDNAPNVNPDGSYSQAFKDRSMASWAKDKVGERTRKTIKKTMRKYNK